MTFTLTDELIDDIISAMDNQDKAFVVDAEAGQLVELDDSISPDDNLYYGLPEWKPADGFSIREEFVKNLHAPLARESLQNVLHSGRGVFKNFRNVLKEYPDIDKRWHLFKYRYMSARINEWYNSLREIWGLEKLDQLGESDEVLVYDDFSFKEYNASTDKKTVLFNITPSSYTDEELPSEIRIAIYNLWADQFKKDESTKMVGYVCYSLSDEFAGCITTSSLNNQEKIVIVTSLFVPEQFRGLGIGTELITMCVSKLQSYGIEWVLLPNFITPEIIQPLLARTGFNKTGSGYILHLGD